MRLDLSPDLSPRSDMPRRPKGRDGEELPRASVQLILYRALLKKRLSKHYTLLRISATLLQLSTRLLILEVASLANATN